MAEQMFVERRQHQRHPLATGIQFHHGPSQQDCLGRCVDISAGGMKMHVPPNVPVRVGQPIRLSMGSVNRPEFSDLGEKPIDATIVRVGRSDLLAHGHLAVGVKFYSTVA